MCAAETNKVKEGVDQDRITNRTSPAVSLCHDSDGRYVLLILKLEVYMSVSMLSLAKVSCKVAETLKTDFTLTALWHRYPAPITPLAPDSG